MQDRLVRAPQFQEYNEDKKFEVKKDHRVGLTYDNYTYQEVL